MLLGNDELNLGESFKAISSKRTSMLRMRVDDPEYGEIGRAHV